MIYLSSPYSHPEALVRAARFRLACEAVAKMLRAGEHVISPIVHCHPVAIAHDLPTDFAFWQAYNRDTLKRCDRMVVLKLAGWEESVGVAGEIEMAAEFNIPVEYREP